MPILQDIVGSINPVYDNNQNEADRKGTQAFYYFHAKKWATRIYIKFIEGYVKPWSDLMYKKD